MLTTIALGLHHAVLDLASGDGFLILPLPRQDVRLDDESLQRADYEAAVTDLRACGWGLAECDEDGVVRHFQGFTADGRALVGLSGDHPMNPDMNFAERALAWSEAKRVAQSHRCTLVMEQDSF